MIRIRQLPANEGVAWIKEGWALFKKTPTLLIILFLTTIVIYFLLDLIPFGGLLQAMVIPALTGGYYLAIQHVEAGDEPTFGHLFRAFTDPHIRMPLLTLGLIALITHIVMVIITMVLTGGAINTLMAYQDIEHGVMIGMGNMSIAYLALGINLSILFILWLTMFFAIPLVMLDQINPFEALLLSLKANLSNFMAWLVFSLLMLLLTLFALIPLGLGLIFLLPVSAAAIYRAYRRTFEINPQEESQSAINKQNESSQPSSF